MISFVIPTRNEEKVIEKILRCISRYSGEREIIVSDGMSSDGTVRIARKYADKVLEYKGSRRQTIAAGRNAGAAAAHGEYLVFLDADVYIPNPDNFFRVALECFRVSPNLAGLTAALHVLPEMETRADRIIFGINNFVNLIANNVLKIGSASGEFLMVRTDLFRHVGGFNELLVAAEDQDLFWKLKKNGPTRFEKSLIVYHTGRRAHAIGWPKLLFSWEINILSAFLRKKSVNKEWTDVR